MEEYMKKTDGVISKMTPEEIAAFKELEKRVIEESNIQNLTAEQKLENVEKRVDDISSTIVNQI